MKTLRNTPRLILSPFSRRFLYSTIALAAFLLPQHSHADAGDLYVADSSGLIYKFTPAGVRSILAVDVHQPVALAFDRAGNLFIGESGSCACIPENPCECPPAKIVRFTPSGEKTVFATLDSSDLSGLAFDSSGNLCVSAGLDILKFAPDGTQSTFASGVDGVWALAFDALGNLYAAVNPNGPASVLKFAPDGSKTTFVTLPGPASSITGLAFDPVGNLFLQAGGSILKINPAGSKTTVATGNFHYPLAFDANGNLFAGLFTGSPTEPSIVKFTPARTRTTFAFAPPFSPSALAFEPVTEKLRNISARGFVQTGENVLIAGLIVGGNALATNGIVIRAIGPSLSRAGVANPLQDTTLELRNSSGVLIKSNDNWRDTQEAQITKAGLAPTDAHESAIYAALPAGTYTAIVRGANRTTGVAMVEVYNLSN